MTINFHQIKYFLIHFFSAKRKGHGVHSPFAYRLCEEVFYNEDEFYPFHQLEELRLELLKNKTVLEIEDLGVGSKNINKKNRTVREIAKHSLSSEKKSQLIFRLANFLNSKNIIEMGTSLGLNTLYLSQVNNNAKVFTIEGSKSLFDFAKNISERKGINNIEFINGNFDTEFEKLLKKIDTPDLIYFDGNHSYEATINYFKMALRYKNENTVFIFDDIYWSEEMTRAWQEIIAKKEVILSIDCFDLGLVFFRNEFKEKSHLKIYV